MTPTPAPFQASSNAQLGWARRVIGWLRGNGAQPLNAPDPQASEQISGTGSPSIYWGGISWDNWVTGNVGEAAGAINERSARAISTVVACVNLIAHGVASMPMHLYRRMPNDEREPYKDDLWWLLNERPLQAWSAFSFWTFLVASKLLHGDGFARIVRRGYSPGVYGFEPLHPLNVTPRLLDGVVVYDVRPLLGGGVQTYHRDDIIHVPGPGFDGLRSMSQLAFGLRNPAGIALQADEQYAAFLRNGVRADFALELPGRMTTQQQEDMRRTFVERHSGRTSARPPIILAGGAKIHQLNMNVEDAQLLGTREFQVEEICRVFGVPPHMVGHVQKTTSFGSGVESMTSTFLKMTLMPHMDAIEQEFNHKLFLTSRNFCEFNTAGTERGDIKGRYECYRIALGRAGEPAWMRPSEVRRLENLPPDPELDDAAEATESAIGKDASSGNEPPQPAEPPAPAEGDGADPATND